MPPTARTKEETNVSSDEGDITYVEEGNTWVAVDTRGGREKRTAVSQVYKEDAHPNKPPGWEPPVEVLQETYEPSAPTSTAPDAVSLGGKDEETKDRTTKKDD